ncbi:TMEM175 family protein, partial [Candidatus Margulisiibacteriota bacterium]
MSINNDQRADPSTKRLEALADGIFAIAMTLLVLNLSVPHITSQLAPHELPAILNAQTNDLFTYFLSFFLLAVFWI